MRGGLIILILTLISAAPLASAQATRPTLGEDLYESTSLPERRGPTTQATSTAASPGTSADIFDTKRMVLALAIVLLAIFVSHRVWKKLGLPGGAGKLPGVLQIVSRLSVSPKQQIILVRVGKRLVLVGNSGTQMNSLCEIGDPEEAALLLGEMATQREESSSATFNAVLGSEEKQFEDENLGAGAPAEDQANEDEDAAIASTRAELSGLAEKVRSLSSQFRRA